ncbi:RsmB/NOP family class I SAM-dependent RNA methyltransferase [Litoreibacter janthinus]|uniref:16S rRNA (Cytosine967-C5)-methyltransferase n=1 Tax=Litoreibacter janthinus TaxID=670154 RepID=A0A1I6H733_9RHOB|nr:RsmB/NOP family class I SAM-dependent RNA methyltransferase [Litoreibacter janthinus]SFR50269.1 16S rRNA (cytosine967-C5)-methyltransferase [Litoreibacter janthinus]
MTPSARLSAAIEVLDQYLSGTAAEKALTNWARRSRFAGSKDRAAVRDIVFDCLRKRGEYARLGLTARALVLCHAAQGASSDEVKDVFSGEGHAPGPLSAEEAAGLNEVEPEISRDMAFNMPDWLARELKVSVGDDALAVAKALTDRAAVFLRVNLSRGTREQAIASLAADGVIAQPHELASTALQVIENPRKVAASGAYQNGLVELQDAASQALCAELPPVGRMLDYCAGGGGKVLAYGDRNDAQLFAHDLNTQRLRDLGPRAKRAGVKVQTLTKEQCRAKGPFDLVLCDVPCSGSGAWRRSPEGKWSLSEAAFEELLAVQQAILGEAKDLVADGGVLAYATCSVFSRENETQIARFCTDHGGWRCEFERRFSPLEGGDGFYIAYLTNDRSFK